MGNTFKNCTLTILLNFYKATPQLGLKNQLDLHPQKHELLKLGVNINVSIATAAKWRDNL